MINPGRIFLNSLRKVQRKFAKKRVLVVGDSHARIFRQFLFLTGLPRVHFHVAAKGGATASGLATPNSKTQAYQVFRKALNEIPRDLVMVQLGEVDTGYVIWYRAKKHNASVDDMFDLAIQTYSNFLKEIAATDPVLVISAPLPTIRDDNQWGEVADLRKEVVTTQKERTDLTVRFNQRMQEFCSANGISYLNLDADCMGPDGVVASYYMNSNPLDHHYHTRRYVRLLCKRLKEFFNAQGS